MKLPLCLISMSPGAGGMISVWLDVLPTKHHCPYSECHISWTHAVVIVLAAIRLSLTILGGGGALFPPGKFWGEVGASAPTRLVCRRLINVDIGSWVNVDIVVKR